MKIKSTLTLTLTIFVILTSCSRQQREQTDRNPRVRVPGKTADLARRQLFCDGFEALPLQSKRYAYHLYRACKAGGAAVKDQPSTEAMIDELEQAISFAPTEASSYLMKLVKYLQTDDKGFYNAYRRLWFEAESRPVEFIFTLTGAEDDSVDGKPAFEAMILIEDPHPDELIDTLVNDTSWSLDAQLIDDNHDPGKTILSLFKAYQLLYATDSRLPMFRYLWKANRVKGFILTNVIETYTREAGARLASININLRWSFIMPELKLLRNRMGGVKDVVVSYKER